MLFSFVPLLLLLSCNPVGAADVARRADVQTYGRSGKHFTFLNSESRQRELIQLHNQAENDEVVDVEYIADTKLPTQMGHFRLRAYRVKKESSGWNDPAYQNTNMLEPVVIYHSDHPPFGEDGQLAHDVHVRVHDQCFTSEVFGSQRCDCKEQLELALLHIKKHGGAVIYLQQEGRGIGLANKVAAYQLQDSGFDTVDANLELGLPEDCRQYGVVPSILRDMNIGSIKLMTNNPRKVERLESLGMDISGTVPVLVPEVNEYNRRYIETKQARMRHRNFGQLLQSSPSHVPTSR